MDLLITVILGYVLGIFFYDLLTSPAQRGMTDFLEEIKKAEKEFKNKK